MIVHQSILEQLSQNVLPYVFNVHGLDIPYPAELWVNGDTKFKEGVVSFRIGENGYLIGEYSGYDANRIYDPIGFRLYENKDCKLVIPSTEMEIPVRDIRSSGKARMMYNHISIPDISVYECEIATWLGDPESKMDSASIFMTGLPDINMFYREINMPEESLNANMSLRRREIANSKLSMESGDWKIELEQPRLDTDSRAQLLSVVTLSTSDGSPFVLNDEHDGILSALRIFLSFQSGAWINTHLIVCYSKNTFAGYSKRAFVNRLSTSDTSSNSTWTATDRDTWPHMFDTFWKQWNRPNQRDRLGNAIAHYIVSNAIFQDSQASAYAAVPARSTLEALTRWWTGKDYDFEFSGEDGRRFIDLLLEAVHKAELGKDAGRVIDIEEVKKVIEKGILDRNAIGHGSLGKIEDEEMSHILPRSLYLHNLARLLISAKLGIRDSHTRGYFYTPKFEDA